MPIYAYRCTSCGHAQDVLQKMSDALLTVCPSCGAATYAKQLTAAGFQLKGSGWYATDFKGSGAAPAAAANDKGSEGEKKSESEKKGDTVAAEAGAAKAASSPAASPAAKTDSAASS